MAQWLPQRPPLDIVALCSANCELVRESQVFILTLPPFPKNVSRTDSSGPTLPRVHLCLCSQTHLHVSIFLFPVNSVSLSSLERHVLFQFAGIPSERSFSSSGLWSVNTFPALVSPCREVSQDSDRRLPNTFACA